MANNIDSNQRYPFRGRLRDINEYLLIHKWKVSKRYLIAILMNIGLAICFSLRCNYCLFKFDKDELATRMAENITDSTHDYSDEEFLYSGAMNNYYLISYILIQIPSGIFSYKSPPNVIFGISILSSSVIAFLAPALFTVSRSLLLLYSFLQGIFQGAAIPAILGIIARWSPPSERATLTTIAYSGTFFGFWLGCNLSKLICTQFPTWDSTILYVNGIAGLIWYILWWTLVFEDPSTDPYINEAEYIYIKRTLGVPKKNANQRERVIPWQQIFSSIPAYALFVTYMCRALSGFYYFHPDFIHMTFIYHYEHAYLFKMTLLMVISLILAGYLAEILQTKTEIDVKIIRKSYVCGGFILQSILLLCEITVVYYELDKSLLFLIGEEFNTVVYCFVLSAYLVNHLDIAQNYACITLAIANIVGAIFTTIPDELILDSSFASRHRNYINLVSLILHFIGAAIFGVFGRTELQSWAKDNQNRDVSMSYSTANPEEIEPTSAEVLVE